MEKEIKKILYKVLPFVLCLCIVSGAAAPAYASSTTSDGSAHNLWDLYWTTSSNPSGKNGSWYGVVRILLKDIFDKIELLQTDQRNLWTYNSTSYRLKNFTDTTSLSDSYYISSGAYPMSWLLNSMANLSQNTGYTANQFYNSNSNFNKAMSAMVSLNQNFKDYSTVLNNIKNNTDNLSGIKTDTANLSGIKTDTANLSGIKTDTANLSDIKTDTANLSGIKSDIESFNNDFNNIDWTIVNNISGIKSSPSGEYLNATIYSKNFYIYFNPVYGTNIYKIVTPLKTIYNTLINTPKFEVGYFNNNDFFNTDSSVISFSRDRESMIMYVYVDSHIVNNTDIVIHIETTSNYELAFMPDNNLASVSVVNADNKDFYDVQSWVYNFNILELFRQAKELFFDDKTLAAKKANQAQEDSVLSNFTGTGAASASVSDFGAVKDSMVDFKSGFSGGASSSDTFSFMSGDSNAWDWFTQDTANDLDRTQGSNTRLLRGSSDVAYDTPLLDSYYNSILSILGGDK